MSELVLSSTSLDTYLSCHLSWWFAYVVAKRGQSSEQLDVGIATHSVAEWLLLAKRDGTKGLPPPDIPPYGHVHDEAIRLGNLYERDVLPLIEPTHIEAVYQFRMGGILYQSILDAADAHGVVRDLKTTGHRPSKDHRRYRISMIGHALGYEILTGHTADKMILDYLVRTKTAYYWPVDLGPLTDDDADLFEATIVGVAADIADGDFEPTGLSSPWACAMCKFKTMCGPYQRYKEATDAKATSQ